MVHESTKSLLQNRVVKRGDAPDSLILHQHPDAQFLVRWQRLPLGTGQPTQLIDDVRERNVGRMEGLTFEQAAVVAVSGSTALQAVRDHGKVRPGQKVLIIGASGGVGTYAVQLARTAGARVIADHIIHTYLFIFQS